MGEDGTKPVCGNCGAELEPGDRFCDQCGEECGVRSAECGVTSDECGVRSEGRSAADPAADSFSLGGDTEIEGNEVDTGYGMRDTGEEMEVRGQRGDGREEGSQNSEGEHRTSNVEHRISNVERRTEEVRGQRVEGREEEGGTRERGNPSNPFQTRPAGDELSDCTQFRLEYNEARIFVEGRPSSFNFRLTALSEEAKRARKITLEVCFGNGIPALEKTLGYTFGPFRNQHVLNVPHTPESAGVGIHAELMLRFELKGRPHRYGTNIQWNCISPHNQQKALENLVINLKADANYASDQNIRLLESLGRSDHESLGAELEKLNLEPRWNQLPLSELEGMSLSQTLPPIHPGVLPVRTLHLPGGMRLHLVHGANVTLGRQKEINTLAVRLFDAEGRVMPQETRRISRTHCSFLLTHQGLRVADGDGRGARSSAGSFLDGKPVNSEGVILGSRKNYALGLGSPALTDISTFRILTGMANDWIRRVQWAAIRRQDGFASREMFLLLDGVCCLRDLQADLPDLDVHRTERGFDVFCGDRRVEFDLAGNEPCSGLRFTPYQPLGIQL